MRHTEISIEYGAATIPRFKSCDHYSEYPASNLMDAFR